MVIYNYELVFVNPKVYNLFSRSLLTIDIDYDSFFSTMTVVSYFCLNNIYIFRALNCLFSIANEGEIEKATGRSFSEVKQYMRNLMILAR